MCSSVSACLDLMIVDKSVSIRSDVMYSSLNSASDAGLRIVLVESTFSCFKRRMIFNSLRVLCAKTLCSKTFSIFLMATRLSPSGSEVSFAATTVP